MSDSTPPKGRFSRSKKLLGLATSIATRELTHRFGGALAPARIAQAKAIVETLGQMKGAAMKAGQLLSIEAAEFFPPEVIEILSKLQDSGKTMDFAVVKQVLVRELGAEGFAKLQGLTPEPIASASIGQVHAARITLPDGTDLPVAVKVQFPGIAESIDSDLSLLGTLAKSLVTLSKYQANLTPLFAEINELLKQETRYLTEAELLTEYQGLAANVPGLKVPRVFMDLTTQSVLTMSLEPGLKLKDWMARKPPVADREYFGRLILDLYFREFFEWGLVQTDPNFGNFLFRPTQRELVILDFGATKRYTPEFRSTYAGLLRSVRTGDRATTLQIAHEMGLIDPRESEEAVRLFFKLLQKSLAPMDPAKQPFYFGDSDFTQEMREAGLTLAQALRFSPPPRALIFLHRKLGGVFHLLRTLDIRIDISSYWKKVDPTVG